MMFVMSPVVTPVRALPALIAVAMRQEMVVPVVVAVAVMRVLMHLAVVARLFWSRLHTQSLSRADEEPTAGQICPRGNKDQLLE